ncbi:hypothetical protein Hanom_Chr02g00161561 [Helianthus anomalus]
MHVSLSCARSYPLRKVHNLGVFKCAFKHQFVEFGRPAFVFDYTISSAISY